MIVDERTTNGLMEPARLFESPYVDHAATRLDLILRIAGQTGSTCEEVVQSLEEPLDVTSGDVRSEAHS